MTLEARQKECWEKAEHTRSDPKYGAALENISLMFQGDRVQFYYKWHKFADCPLMAFEEVFKAVVILRKLHQSELIEFTKNI